MQTISLDDAAHGWVLCAASKQAQCSSPHEPTPTMPPGAVTYQRMRMVTAR